MENTIIWHSCLDSPCDNHHVLIRVKFPGDEITQSKYRYYVWKYVKDSDNEIFGSHSFYITHDRHNGLPNVCLPGDGKYRYKEYLDGKLIFPDYEWAYID